MKKLLLLAAMVAIASGCAKELNNIEETPSAETPSADGLVTYSFNASADEMKATISDAGAFAWSAGDEIAVWNDADSKFYTFSCASGNGTFTAEAKPGAVFTKAYYPASIAVDGNSSQISLPNSYTQAESVDGKIFPMVATVSGSTLEFKHLASLLKITINDVPANATTLTLSSPATLCGTFAVTQSGGYDVISAGNSESSVSVALSNSAKSNLAFYFPVPVGTYNYTITLGDGTTTMLTQATTSAKDIARASFHGLKALTVSKATTDYKLRGRYSGFDWGDDSILDFVEVDNSWEWLKTTINNPDYYVDFKLYKSDGNVYTGNSVSNNRKIVGTIIPVADDRNGYNFSIYTNRTSLDVYYSPSHGKLFTLPAGSDFVIPTTFAGEAVDEYALIGWHATDSWGKDIFLEAVYGHDDWRTVRIETNTDAVDNDHPDNDKPHFSFKFRRNGGWSDQIGGIYDYQHKANTYCYAKTINMSDLTFYPGSAGSYDVYLNKNFNSVFILPEGTAFSVPGRKEQEDLVSVLKVIGGLNGHNWDQSFDLTFASDNNHEWYALKNSTKLDSNSAIVFKLWNGGWGKGRNVGFSWTLNPDNASFIGDMNTIYPLWLRDGNDDIPNIQLGTDGGHVDIYIKADLSEIFTLPAGTTFTVPTP